MRAATEDKNESMNQEVTGYGKNAEMQDKPHISQISAVRTVHTKQRGQNGEYEIEELLGEGRSGLAYKAKIISILSSQDHVSNNLVAGDFIVIKTPRLKPLSIARLTAKAAQLYEKFLIDLAASQRLRDVPGAAQVIDVGLYRLQLNGNVIQVPFTVQEFINGESLAKYMERIYGGKFTGIPDGKTFLDWSIRITSTLGPIHQRQVIHGDIHEDNIMISNGNQIIFIDFGEARLRDLSCPGIRGTFNSGMRRVPPEGSGTIGGDVYSLGGVLYYLATGQNPPSLRLKDIDEHRENIAERIRSYNPALYASNRGIVDIVARCLSYYQPDRPPNTDAVLRDLETFADHLATLARENPQDLVKALSDLDMTGNDLFSWMARLQIRVLRTTIGHMTKGAYDLVGNHEDIASGMTEYLSCLECGDQYFTISLPSFWSRRNLGTNGLFLSMNVRAVRRGATIRRIFLITPNDMASEEVKSILGVHIELARELEDLTADRDVCGGGLYTAFVVVSKEQLEKYAEEGKHNYGLLLRKADSAKGGLLIVPVYSTDGAITMIQFRSDPTVIAEFQQDFLDRLSVASPLTSWPLDFEGFTKNSCAPEAQGQTVAGKTIDS